MKANHHILQSGKPWEKTYVLKGATYPFTNNLVSSNFQKPFRSEDDLPIIRFIEPGDDIEGCGFPRPVRSDDAKDLALRYTEIDFVECLETTEADRKIPYL